VSNELDTASCSLGGDSRGGLWVFLALGAWLSWQERRRRRLHI